MTLRWRRPVVVAGALAALVGALAVTAWWGGAVTGRAPAGLPDAGH